MTQRKYEIADFRKAIQLAGPSVAQIASYLGCTRSTVYRYLRDYPELKAAFEQQEGTVESSPQYPREVFLRAIPGSFGVKAAVARAVGCSPETVKNALKRWSDLAEAMATEKASLVGDAVSALAADVHNKESDGHQRAYMFVLKTLGKNEGFVERTEVDGTMGVIDLPEDVRAMVEAMGLDMSEVVRQFTAMIRARAQMQRGNKR
jgi:AcrR family transcriptional regulator